VTIQQSQRVSLLAGAQASAWKRRLQILAPSGIGTQSARRAFGPGHRIPTRHGQIMMHQFDSRTLMRMEVALDRVCRGRPDGENHTFRRQIAESIIRCAISGRTSMGQLAQAGERAVSHLRPEKESA
jgi:hypothetical protein